MGEKKYVMVEAEWLADQFLRYTNDPMEYILGFPEVNLLTSETKTIKLMESILCSLAEIDPVPVGVSHVELVIDSELHGNLCSVVAELEANK